MDALQQGGVHRRKTLRSMSTYENSDPHLSSDPRMPCRLDVELSLSAEAKVQ